MMARRKVDQPEPEQPALKVARSRAEELIDQQIEAGRTLIDRAGSLANEPEYKEWREDRVRWQKFTEEALRSIYTTTGPAEEFSRPPSIGTIAMAPLSLAEQVGRSVETQERQLNNLISIRERLQFVRAIAERESSLGVTPDAEDRGQSQVFIVHGHDDATKEKVVRQLEKAGSYSVVVLHEQPSEGRTLIEKFEEYASASDFAVILLTADDVGADREHPDDLEPRGRQNVIFELGYFVGALGRSQVAVLYEDGVAFPSDYKGIVYVPLGDEAWRYKLLKELKAAGLDYDLNQIV